MRDIERERESTSGVHKIRICLIAEAKGKEMASDIKVRVYHTEKYQRNVRR